MTVRVDMMMTLLLQAVTMQVGVKFMFGYDHNTLGIQMVCILSP